MKHLLLLTLVVSILGTSCASQFSVAKLTSVNEDYSWEQGRQVVKTEDENYTMYTVFERNEGRNIVFDVEIFNHSGSEITLDPASFYYKGTDYSGKQFEKDLDCYAIDPEGEILDLERAMKQAGVDARNAHKVGVAMAATGVALSLASAVLGSDNTVSVEPCDESSGVEIAFGPSFSKTNYDLDTTEDQYQYWANQVLRKTTLRDGESARGKVYFKMHNRAAKYEFEFPLGEHILHVEYAQQTY